MYTSYYPRDSRNLEDITKPSELRGLIEPSESTLATNKPKNRNVVFGMSGNYVGFLDEFEVALKSLLLNAPSDPLTIHIVADNDAYESLEKLLFHKAKLDDWQNLPSPITIQTYNIEPMKEKWKQTIEKNLAIVKKMTKWSIFRHTIGAYFRLFVGELLPPDVDDVVYLDSDVVLMASLDDIWRRQVPKDDKILFSWGAMKCSGFMIMRPRKMQDRLWEIFAQIPESTLQEELAPWPAVGDQFVLRMIEKQSPEVVGKISEEWDVSAANGPWKRKKEKMLQSRPNGAHMLHFNGGGENKVAYFKEEKYIGKNPKTWGLVRYYVDLPWQWTYSILKSRLKDGKRGHTLKINYNKKMLPKTETK